MRAELDRDFCVARSISAKKVQLNPATRARWVEIPEFDITTIRGRLRKAPQFFRYLLQADRRFIQVILARELAIRTLETDANCIVVKPFDLNFDAEIHEFSLGSEERGTVSPNEGVISRGNALPNSCFLDYYKKRTLCPVQA